MLALTTEGAADFGKEVDSSLLAAHVARRLRDLDANEIDVRPHLVTFKGGVFRLVANWSVLVNFGLGDLTVEPDSHEIRYRSSYQQPVICSAIIFAVICLCTLIFSVIHGTFPSTWTVLAMFLAWPLPRFYQRQHWGVAI
jgi:hypothetical protein